MEEYAEYTVFKTETRDGREVEMAVLDSFSFEDRDYVVAALVEGDTINEDGMYIYAAGEDNGELKAEKIPEEDYERVCQAYLEYAGSGEQ